jgi:NarL family two-component system response regulator LiaR
MPGSRPIRILICDDHRILGDALALMVGMDDGLELVADPFNRAETAVAAIAQFEPDVVLMDVDLPGMNGIEATRAIVAERPSTKVVVMSGSSDPDAMLVAAVGAGAAGFLPKSEAASKILAAVRAAAEGEPLLDSTTLMRVLRQVGEAEANRGALDQKTNRLTGREVEILQSVAQGESNADIANALFLSVHTVQTHVRNILVKLEVHSKLQAVALAVKAGAITVSK